MSKLKKNSQKMPASAGLGTATSVMQVARVMPAVVLVSKAERSDMRSVAARAPAAFITLVAKMAEENGGSIAGVPIDAAATRDALTQVEHLRDGVAAARAVARYLEQEALLLASGIAQEALSATTSLEALGRTLKGRTLAAKAADLCAAQRKGSRRSAKVAKDTGTTTTPTNGAAVATPAIVAATLS